MTMADQKRCRELFDYSPETGKLTWKVDRVSGFGKVNVRAGAEAGFVGPKGYRIVRFDGKSYKAHRLIWLMLNGDWPQDEIDHINGDRADNRLGNLRPVKRSQNAKNRSRHTRGTSGVKGVFWDAAAGKWRASIAADGQIYHLGMFEAKAKAGEAYREAARRLHGEFMRVA